MTFDEYQKAASEFAKYPTLYIQDPADKFHGIAVRWVYASIGLNGEVGELQDKLKKLIRDGHGLPNPEEETAISAEIGDALWYLSELSSSLGLSLSQVAQDNLIKLTDRWQRGKIGGSGDTR